MTQKKQKALSRAAVLAGELHLRLCAYMEGRPTNPCLPYQRIPSITNIKNLKEKFDRAAKAAL